MRRARVDAGLTISETAKRAGVSRDTISNAERGRHSLQGPTLSKIARALGRAPSELLAEEERLAPKAPSSSLEPSFTDVLEDEQRESIHDLVLTAARRQAEQDRKAANRTLASECIPQPAYFKDHENAAVQRLLEYPPDELAGSLMDLASRVIELESTQQERGPSPLAESLIATVRDWQKIVADSPAANTAGAVYFALHLEDRFSVLIGDGEQWSQVPPMQRSEIYRLMKMIEELAERHMARIEAEAERSEVIDLAELRQRLERSRESRRQAMATSA